jgi:hypothetical protein
MNVETESFNVWTAFDFAVSDSLSKMFRSSGPRSNFKVGFGHRAIELASDRAIDSYILLNTLLIKECLISKQFSGLLINEMLDSEQFLGLLLFK